MPEEGVLTQVLPSQQAPPLSPTIQQLEQMAFGGKTEESPSEVPSNQPESTPATAAETTSAPVQPDINLLIKESLGFDNLDIAKQEIEKLKSLPKSDFKFENDESRKMAEAISKGDRKTILEILAKQDKIESLVSAEVSDDTAPEIIKLGMALKYPTLKPEQIEFQYRQDYGLPKEPVMKDTEYEVEFQERHNEWAQKVSDIKMKIAIAATMAKPEIESAKSKIDISSILPSTQVDKDYEAYQASIANAQESYNKAVPLINALKEADVPIVVSLNDAGNKMQFEIAITPESSDFEAARQDSLALNILKNCYDKDGNIIPKEIQRLALISNNFDKYSQSIARQAVNAERKRVLEEETKGGGIQRDFNTNHVEPTELQRLEKMAFG